MKRDETISSLLGVTQRDIALLLRIGFSHWSMYESGKRDLPPAALQLMSEMLEHVQAQEKRHEGRLESTDAHAKLLRKHISNLLHENEYQQLVVDKKINAEERKQKAQFRLAQLVGFLQDRRALNEKETPAVHRLFIKGSSKTLATDHSKLLLKLELKQQLLQLEQALLEAKLKG